MNAPPIIAFDESAHRYTVNGRAVPSVTEVLRGAQDFSGIPPDVLEAAANRGRAVHRMVELDISGTLDEASVHDSIRPHLDHWRAFRESSGFQPIACEYLCASARYGYAGRLDLIGTFPDKPGFAVIDLKTSAAIPASVGLQTAGYAQAVAEMAPAWFDSAQPLRRYCLHLTAGACRIKALDNSADITVFNAALTIWRWCNDNKQ